MKKIPFLITISMAVLCSCNEMLDLQKDGRITMEEIFTTRNGVRGYLNSCYNYRPLPTHERSSLCDDAQDSDGTFANSIFSYWYGNAYSSISFSATDGNPWTGYYEGIRKCNIFIANTAGMAPVSIHSSEGELTGWIAQARTLRALYYLQLIKRYGAVPLLTEPLPPTHDYSTDRRAPVSQVVARILKDCDDALAAPDIELGFSWTVLSGQFGIMTRAVAHAIKSQAITYACSPRFTDGTYTWADATRINAEALYQCTTHGYELFRDVPDADVAQNAYALYFITRPDEMRAYDKETIYGRNNVNIWQQSGLLSTAGQEKAGVCPTQELVDSYEMAATGEPPLLGYSDPQHLNPILNPAASNPVTPGYYNPAHPYVGRDPRFYATIYYNGAERALSSGGVTYRDDRIPLSFTPDNNNVIRTDLGNGEYRLQTTGDDPWIFTTALTEPINAPPPKVFISFRYKSANLITDAQFYFADPDPWYPNATFHDLVLNQATEWTDYELDITGYLQTYGWGSAAGHRIRFEVGSVATAQDVYIKDFEIRVYGEITISSNPVETFVGGEDGITVSDRRTTHTGYYLRKYNNWRSNRDNAADGSVRLFRLAELYLNFAESAYQSHGPDVAVDLGGGLSMSARGAVNEIRNRAGMPDFPPGMMAAEFEKKYRNERRVELAFEEHRYFDIRRWNMLEETERYLTGMRITKEGANFTYTRFGFERGSWLTKYYWYPVPQSEVNKMQDLTGTNWQNPGWN